MIKNLLLLATVIFALFILGEFSLRFLTTEPNINLHKHRTQIYIDDPRYGWKFKTGNYTLSDAFRQEVMVTINSEGFRKGSPKDNNNLENKKNIMFIGDSVTAGRQVNDHETFADLVQTKSGGKYSTYNFGVDGFGTDQEYLTLKDYKHKVKPNFVIYTFVYNDLITNLLNNISHTNASWGKPYFDEKGVLHPKTFSKKLDPEIMKHKIKRILYTNLLTYRLASRAKRQLFALNYSCELAWGNHIDQYDKMNDEKNNQIYVKIWKMMELLLKMMKKETESVGGELIVLDHIYPTFINEVIEQITKCAKEKKIDYNAKSKYSTYKIREITSKLGIKLIKISLVETTAFSNKYKCDLVFFNKNRLVIDGHLTRCGHDLIASKILNVLDIIDK